MYKLAREARGAWEQEQERERGQEQEQEWEQGRPRGEDSVGWEATMDAQIQGLTAAVVAWAAAWVEGTMRVP